MLPHRDMSPHTILSLVHIFIVAPLLFAIAKTSWIPATATAGIGGVITLYHGYKAVAKLSAGQPAWVNLIHALIVGPTLLYKGLVPDAPRWISEVILMFAAAAIGYHGYYLLVSA